MGVRAVSGVVGLKALASSEQAIIAQLLNKFFETEDFGRIEVSDEESVACAQTSSRALIESNIGHTEQTTLRLIAMCNGGFDTIGAIVLIHGNGADVIHDIMHKAEHEKRMDAIIHPVEELAQTLA